MERRKEKDRGRERERERRKGKGEWCYYSLNVYYISVTIPGVFHTWLMEDSQQP